MPTTLQMMMRHSSIQTTLKYYVAQAADDIAAELWGQFGNTSGNSTPATAETTAEIKAASADPSKA